jgi:GTPase
MHSNRLWKNPLVADLILLLIDCPDDVKNIKIRYSICWKVLKELEVDKSRLSVVLSSVKGMLYFPVK